MTPDIAQMLRKLAVVLFVVLLVPGVGLAAPEAASSPSQLPGTEAPAPLRLMEEGSSTEATQASSPVVRLAAEIGGEVVATLVVFSAVYGAIKLGCSSLNCVDTMAYGFFIGASLAAPVGAWMGGSLAGGRGSLRGAFVGAGVAALLGWGSMQFITNERIHPFIIPLFCMVGSVVGYEVSQAWATPSRDAASARLQPMLAVSGNGAALGLSGRF